MHDTTGVYDWYQTELNPPPSVNVNTAGHYTNYMYIIQQQAIIHQLKSHHWDSYQDHLNILVQYDDHYTSEYTELIYSLITFSLSFKINVTTV